MPSESEMDIDSEPVASQARLGLLTHTLVWSPIVQWALPARLRSRYQNDVVLVGERSLRIKEAISGTHLEDVTSKSDFDAHIMAAKVINVSTELPWEVQMKARSAGADASPENDKEPPPQIMVLSLASKELVFLYYSRIAGQFIHYRRPLPSDVSTFERFGRTIAVEPRSRAVAVSASCDYFGVFMLKAPPVVQSQMAENQLDPVAEERFFRIDGDIIFMEFLYPSSEDKDEIILLLLVSHNHETYAVCYEWNAKQTLRQSHPRITRKMLPREDRLPTMMIPLTKASSFMLVTTTAMSIYKNKLEGPDSPTQYPLPNPDHEQQRSPLWTRWARPLRNDSYNEKHDDIYLCREDGRLDYMGIGNEGAPDNDAQLGHLSCDVDAAFGILDLGYEGDDLIIAAGNTGDGALFVQKARDQPRCVQKFMNWSPITDSVIVKPPPSSSDTTDTITGDRLFVCSASTYGQGAVVELRHGVEAQIGLVVSLEELSGARDIWILPDSANGGVFMLTSDPVSTTALYLPADFSEEISAIDETDSGLDPYSPTLAAGYIEPGTLIQVTDKTILMGATMNSIPRSRCDLNPGQTVAAAAVHGTASLIVAAVRTHQEVHIHLKRINLVDTGIQLSDNAPPLSIDYEPICMTIEKFDIGLFVFIGTGDGRVRTYNADDNLRLLLDVPVTVGDDENISRAIDSIAMIRHAEQPHNKAILLCGLRSGFLVTFDIMADVNKIESPLDIRQGALRHLGYTSVKVQGGGSNIGLLTCGNSFWQVTCSQGDAIQDCVIQRIWITDQNNPAYYPKVIHSFAMMEPENIGVNGLSGSLFCIADGQLMICTLDRVVKSIPRRIDLPGSATKLAYSQHLKSLIVSYSQSAYDTQSDPVKRYTRPYIEFLDPDTQYPIDGFSETLDDQKNKPWRPQGAAGEKISRILEWTPKKGDEEYHFIVIGTARRNQQDRGRVIFLQASRDPSTGQIECSVKYIHKFEAPVYSIVPYGDFTLMIATGHEIVALEPKFAQPRRARSARFSLLSPAISMSSHEPYLYISTARESLLILEATEDKLALRAYDRSKLDGLSHIHIGGDMQLTLASSRGGRVSLLTEKGVTETNKMLPIALCDAHLPSSVTKLVSSSEPSPLSSRFDTLYGTTMNGTVYRFLVLEQRELRLLRLLQDLCIRDPAICPFTPKRTRNRNPVGHEPLEFQPSHMHVDGDILRRLVLRDADYLVRILAGEDEKQGVTSASQLFEEAVRDVFGETSNAAEVVMRWLKKVFHVEF